MHKISLTGKVRVEGTARTKSRGQKTQDICGMTSGSILLHCRELKGNHEGKYWVG